MRNPNYGLCLFICLFVACDKNNIVKDPEPKDPVPVEDIRVIARMTNDFGWKLFQDVATGVSDENVLISPLSVQTALTMAVNGAKGNTLEEMLTVLGCPGCDVKDLNTQTAQLRVLMEKQGGHATLTSANGFFYDPNRIDVLDSFINVLTSDYRAGFQEYNFAEPATVDKINAWVKDNTAGKIDKILDKISAYDLAFLINALYFKADWAKGLAIEDAPGVFYTASNTEVPALYVYGDRKFSTAVRQFFRMVDIPFRDSTYSLSFVQATGSVADQPNWVSQLNSSDLKAMWDSLSYGRAIVSFPKLDVEYEIELIEPLKNMGITKAFSDVESDFSNMGQALIGPGIYISKVLHKAVLKVDEKGAEGAAVTSVGFSTNSVPPQFTFNKPFVIVLRHTTTNAILFAGLINGPS